MTGPLAQLLSDALLVRFEAVLGRLAAPAVGRMRPGLTTEEMDSLTARVGLELPGEAKTWWGWHDGADLDRHGTRLEVGPMVYFGSLEDAVEAYEDVRMRLFDRPGIRENWPAGWLPLIREAHGGYLAVDCASPPNSGSPVYEIVVDDAARLDPVADSLGQLVGWWTTTLEPGGWMYDSATGRWSEDPRRFPSDARAPLFFPES